MNNLIDHQGLMKSVLKITKHCIRDLRNEFQRENPPIIVAMTAQQTFISLLILNMLDDCERIMKGDFDERLETVLGLIGKSIQKFKNETELKEGDYDSNQTTH